MAGHNTYSRVVSWTKVILPLLALGLLSTLFLFSHTPDPEQAIPFARVDVQELAREQRLGSPRIAGTLSDGREIIFTADTAAPVLTAPSQFRADGIEARVDLTSDSVLLIVSDSGLFRPSAEEAELEGNVGLTTSTGINLMTELLEINLATSNAVSPGAVELTGPGLTLNAGSMRILLQDGNEVVSFNDGVRVLYEPQN